MLRAAQHWIFVRFAGTGCVEFHAVPVSKKVDKRHRARLQCISRTDRNMGTVTDESQ